MAQSPAGVSWRPAGRAEAAADKGEPSLGQGSCSWQETPENFELTIEMLNSKGFAKNGNLSSEKIKYRNDESGKKIGQSGEY